MAAYIHTHPYAVHCHTAVVTAATCALRCAHSLAHQLLSCTTVRYHRRTLMTFLGHCIRQHESNVDLRTSTGTDLVRAYTGGVCLCLSVGGRARGAADHGIPAGVPGRQRQDRGHGVPPAPFSPPRGAHSILLRVRVDIIGHARIKYVGKSQPCMVEDGRLIPHASYYSRPCACTGTGSGS